MMKLFLIVILTLFCFASDKVEIQKIDELYKRNKELLADVKLYINNLIKKEQDSLQDMLLDEYSSIKELQNGLKKAYKIAKLNGLNINRLKSLYELSKKTILRSDFIKQDSLQAVSTANSFQRWFDLTGSTYAKIQEEKAEIQKQRVALYKRVTLSFIKAITTKDATKAYNEFKRYANALHIIQSSDANQLIAQAEALVAEQKLVSDTVTTLPVVGDSLDILTIVQGEDLSGRELTSLERGLTLVAIVAPDILVQSIKRNPTVAETLGKMGAYISHLSKKTKKNVPRSAEVQRYFTKLNQTKNEEIQRWRTFYNEKIEEAKRLSSISKEVRFAKANMLERELQKSFERESPLKVEMGEKILQTAKKRDEIIIIRPVNKKMLTRLEEGAYTKGMNVKGKSANSGIANGYIPKKQKFSKLKDKKEIEKFQKKVDKSLKVERVKGVDIVPDMVKSKQLITTKNGVEYKGIELFNKNSKESIALFKSSDGKIVDENFKEVSKDLLKNYDTKNSKPFEVLTDIQGNYLTADIDILSIGSKKHETVLQSDPLMGNINSHEMDTVSELNRAMKSKKYPDRLLVHHGSENKFLSKTSKPDFPLSAYSPDGKVAVIKNERELKDYFHMQKLRGYDLQPNPFWNWGKYDPKIGYK